MNRPENFLPRTSGAVEVPSRSRGALPGRPYAHTPALANARVGSAMAAGGCCLGGEVPREDPHRGGRGTKDNVPLHQNGGSSDDEMTGLHRCGLQSDRLASALPSNSLAPPLDHKGGPSHGAQPPTDPSPHDFPAQEGTMKANIFII